MTGPVLAVDVSPDDPFYGLYSFGWALEVPLLWIGVVLTLWGLWRAWPLVTNRLFVRYHNPGVGVVRATVLFALVWFWFVLQTGAASDIVGFYTWMYVFLALACLVCFGLRVPIVGLYAPADVVERGNLAAAITLGGFALGTAFAFGGALTGEGPGWWVVVVFFFLAYWELRGSMSMVSRLGQLRDEVRLERDVSAGVLLAGVAVSAGLVAGRAAAGNFTGWERDIPDYLRRVAPIVVVPLLAALAGAYSKFNPRKEAIRVGAAALLVAGGFLYYFLT